MSKLPPIPERLRKVDQLALPDHFFLDEADQCYFLWEYVKGARYDANTVSNFIKNFQIPVTDRDKPRWRYKTEAYRHAAGALAKTLPDSWDSATFVPVPPSRVKTDPEYDPRLAETISCLGRQEGGETVPLDLREIVIQDQNTQTKGKGLSPCQGRSKIRPVRRRENRPVLG